MKALFIVNPAAGGSNKLKKITEAVRDVFKSVEGLFELCAAERPGHGAELAARAVERGFEAVVACGGDGTINEIASRLVGTETALGIIPVGSGNGLATSLGIPKQVARAAEVVRRANPRPIDVGSVNGRYFFSTAGFGFDAQLSKRYNEGKISRRVRGIAPYVPLAIIEFARYKPEPVTIRVGANEIKTVPFLLTVANTERYGGGAIIAPGACPDDGLLDLCIVPRPRLLKTPDAANKLLGGNINEMEGYRTLRGDVIEILRTEKTTIHVDGEPTDRGADIKVTVLYRKLKVLVP